MHFSLDPAVLLGLVSIIGAVAIVVGVTVVMEAVSHARGDLPTADEELLPVQPLRLSMIVAAAGQNERASAFALHTRRPIRHLASN